MARMLPRAFTGRSMPLAALLISAACVSSWLGLGNARAMEWSVDPKQSEIAFEASGSGYSARGVFKTYRSEIEFDPETPEQTSVHVTLDMQSASTGEADTDKTLQSEEFFDPRRFPAAEFAARGARPDGDGKYILDGRLTLKGVTKPVSLPFSVTIAEGVAAVKAETAIDRRNFGVGPDSVAGLAVDKEVKLTIRLTATRLDN